MLFSILPVRAVYNVRLDLIHYNFFRFAYFYFWWLRFRNVIFTFFVFF